MQTAAAEALATAEAKATGLQGRVSELESQLAEAGKAAEMARAAVAAEAERGKASAAKELAAEQKKAEQKAEKVAQRTAAHMEKLQEERRALEARLAVAEVEKKVRRRCGHETHVNSTCALAVCIAGRTFQVLPRPGRLV